MAHPANHSRWCPVYKAVDATPDMCGCGADEVPEADDETYHGPRNPADYLPPDDSAPYVVEKTYPTDGTKVEWVVTREGTETYEVFRTKTLATQWIDEQQPEEA